MSAGNVSGTPRKLNLAGLPFKVPGDFNATMKFSPFETEGVPTTGGTMFKMTLVSPNAEGIQIIVNPDEAAELTKIAERRDDYQMAVTLADGTTWNTSGKINFADGVETEENRASIVMIPNKSIGAWKKFN
jgi:hypothetical protein